MAALPAGLPALPGHGPDLPDVVAAANGYLAHREQRLDQIREVVRARGPQVTAAEVVAVVYADVPSEVREAAAWSVAAQLAYLAEQGER